MTDPACSCRENNPATDYPFRSRPDKTTGLAYRRDQSPQQMLDAGLAPSLWQRVNEAAVPNADFGTNLAVCICSENLRDNAGERYGMERRPFNLKRRPH